jgi:hypothetical protein
MDNSYDFFNWLAAQSPCIEVAVGLFFCLVAAPALFAGAATAITALEDVVEIHLTRRMHLRGWRAATASQSERAALSNNVTADRQANFISP